MQTQETHNFLQPSRRSDRALLAMAMGIFALFVLLGVAGATMAPCDEMTGVRVRVTGK